jgi:hypothetical protein
MRFPTDNNVTLRLPDIASLFNSLEDSPFIERNLDSDAEMFILSRVRLLPAGLDPELVIQLSNPSGIGQLEGVEQAVRRYFANRAELKHLEFVQLMRRGRLSLGVGVVFLAICLLLGGLMTGPMQGAAGSILREGLTICGWVAMWRPLEIFLFDWWPIVEEQRRLSRLARMSVRVLLPGEQGIPTGNLDRMDGGEQRRVAA